MTINREAAAVHANPMTPAAELFHSLADPNRLSIVNRLSHGEARVADLVTELGLAQSTVSAHVACLRGCGLVTGRTVGRQTFYAISQPLLIGLLTAAEELLSETGHPIHLCAEHGVGDGASP